MSFASSLDTTAPSSTNDAMHLLQRAYPSVERVDGNIATLRSSARVIALTPLWQETLRAVTRAGLRAMVVTRPDARLTFPLLQIFGRLGVEWVTEDETGTRIPSGLRPGQHDPTVLLQDAVRDPNRISRREATAQDQPLLQVVVTVRHPLRVRDRFGQAAGRIAELLGARVDGIAVAEPVLSGAGADGMALAASRLPHASRMLVFGDGSGAAVSGSIRTWQALERNFEEAKLMIRPAEARGIQPGAALVKLAREFPVQFGSVWQQYGRADLTFDAQWAPYSRPLTMLLGQRVVRDQQFAHEDLVAAGIASEVLNQRAPGLLLDLGRVGAHPTQATRVTDWHRLRCVLDVFGAQNVARALAGGADS